MKRLNTLLSGHEHADFCHHMPLRIFIACQFIKHWELGLLAAIPYNTNIPSFTKLNEWVSLTTMADTIHSLSGLVFSYENKEEPQISCEANH